MLGRMAPAANVPVVLTHGPFTLAAWSRMLPPEAAFSGRTAGWLHGLDMAYEPIEEIRQGIRATSAVRTLADLSRKVDVVEAIVMIDQALRKAALAPVRWPTIQRIGGA
jgi:hypothetical protein